jgi:hypothetical protein
LWGFLKEYGDIKLLMPDFKAVVFAGGQPPLIVATPPRRKIGL